MKIDTHEWLKRKILEALAEGEEEGLTTRELFARVDGPGLLPPPRKSVRLALKDVLHAGRVVATLGAVGEPRTWYPIPEEEAEPWI